MKFSIRDFSGKCDQIRSFLVTFTGAILNGKLHFLYSEFCSQAKISQGVCFTHFSGYCEKQHFQWFFEGIVKIETKFPQKDLMIIHLKLILNFRSCRLFGCFDPFVLDPPFFYLLKTSENVRLFRYFQRVDKGCIGNESVKTCYRQLKQSAI